jgi:AcrR family transcriptional regulator
MFANGVLHSLHESLKLCDARAAGRGGRACGAPRRPTARRSESGRPRTLSAEAIVTAAIHVLDDGGVAGLSMRSVAQRLGTGAASLYAYVSGKEERLELIFDELVGTVPPPTPDPKRWREQITAMMFDVQRVLVSHRDAALAGIGRVPTSPKALAGMETVAAVMAAGGLAPRIIALGSDQAIPLRMCLRLRAGALLQQRSIARGARAIFRERAPVLADGASRPLSDDCLGRVGNERPRRRCALRVRARHLAQRLRSRKQPPACRSRLNSTARR